MTEKIVLRRRTVPKQVILPNGTTFTARYERIGREQLPINIHIKNSRRIGPRNRNNCKMRPGPAKSATVMKKVRYAPWTSLRERLARIKRYRNSRKGQTGNGLGPDLAKIDLTMGSKALNSSIDEEIINKGIDNISNIFKYGVSKIKNENVKKALNSDIENIVVDEAQNKSRGKANDWLF